MVGLEGQRTRNKRSSSIPCITTNYLPPSRRNSNVQEVNSWKDHYCVHKELGRGHFAKVYHVISLATSDHCAAKVIRRRRGGADRLESIREEIRIMKMIWNEGLCKNVIKLIDVYESVIEIGIIMEIAHGGSLYCVSLVSKNGLPEKYVQIVIKKLVKVLQIIHSYNIVHLDLKAENILLRQPYPSTDIALSDFGLAVQLSQNKNHRELAGTPDYIAPEIINYENISTQTDMWSLGVLTYFLLTSKSPFMGESKEVTMMNVSKINYFFPEDIFDLKKALPKDFISKLIIKKQNHRMTSEEALSHDWLKSADICDEETSIPTINNPDEVFITSSHTTSSSSSSSSLLSTESSSSSSSLTVFNNRRDNRVRRPSRSNLAQLSEDVSELECLTFATSDSGFNSSD